MGWGGQVEEVSTLELEEASSPEVNVPRGKGMGMRRAKWICKK